MFAHNSTKEVQILAAAATQRIKLKMNTIFYVYYIDNITLQHIA